MPRPDYSLHDSSGRRKYLTAAELQSYLDAIEPALSMREIDEPRKTLARLVALTGCRISEAIKVRFRDVELVEVNKDDGTIIKGADVTFDSLKRRKSHFRTVTVGQELRNALLNGNHLTRNKKDNPDGFIWEISRPTAFRTIQAVMKYAGIEGSHANARGLRHAYIVKNVQRGVPPHQIAQWAGWSTIAMLQIYADLQSDEKRALALSIW